MALATAVTTKTRTFLGHMHRGLHLDVLNRAEFILDVIGAGATATSKVDWHEIWISSPESTLIDNEIDAIVAQGRNTPAVSAAIGSGFATPWIYQIWTLLVRNLIHYWRSPTYLMAKMMLNIVGGLFIGFTFFQRNNSLEGTQNKLFVRIHRHVVNRILY